MSASEKLRELLDERGVEWRDTGKRLNMGNGVRIPIQTEYEQSCGGRWSTVTEALSGTLTVNNLTPEQAIAATLGKKPHDKTEEWLLKACNQATQDYVKALEKLVQDWQELYKNPDYGECLRLIDRMRKLGIEVEQ